jgi:hypothetical protein
VLSCAPQRENVIYASAGGGASPFWKKVLKWAATEDMKDRFMDVYLQERVRKDLS